MENHLKKNIKETFKNRTITPKRDLWSELEQQLDQQQASTMRKTRYYALAGCLTILIAVGLWFMKPFSENQIIENQIVKLRVKSENEIKNQPENLKETFDVMSQKAIVIQDSNSSKKTNSSIKNQRDKELDAYIDEVLSDVSADKMIALLNQDVSFESKVDSIYQAMNFQNISAEELLLIASTEINIDQYVESKINVDTMLQESDKETFKDRIKQFFDKVSTEYDKLKYALSND
ncbi:hypothetical protein [Capnocytophaga canis]|uniref:Uncharacterized protein n=1 Tax=Capnocytophaga canis TaxID=1848903 RepID=A0A0B7ISE6_9FLAO|nr:hypothetical protein [Capnocytophaga canis]CEN52967.1 conserved hypothetical protein [Capnocytophaga canis]